MTYTEIKERNGKRYFYRVLSIRKGEKVSKKRKYLGRNLNKEEQETKENEADKELKRIKINKTIENIKKKILGVLKKHGIVKAGIFGSYARGEQKKDSDIDILVQLSKPMGFEFAGMNMELEEKLGKKVDLVTYNSLHHLIKDNALKDEVKII